MVVPDDEIVHLFIADITFNKKDATARQYVDNEIYCPITEKQKKLMQVKDHFSKFLKILDKIIISHKVIFVQKKHTLRCLKKIYSTLS